MREPEVPVKVIVGVADGALRAAVRVVVAESCAGVRVRVDGLAVTPEGSPEMVTVIEPEKELIAVAVTVMALLVVPALRVSEPGDKAREKSGAGFGGEFPHVVSRNTAVIVAIRRSALAGVRMSGDGSATLTVPHWRRDKCHCSVTVPNQNGRWLP